MQFKTTDEWNRDQWKKAHEIYERAFPAHGRKNTAIIRRMFERKLCYLHTLEEGEEMVAMAISAKTQGLKALLIDYLAVREDHRGEGIGRELVDHIKQWALEEGCEGIIIEAESESSPENEARIRFWKACGFTVTNYVHHYIWVPEPYRALYLKLKETGNFPTNGEALFQTITWYHRSAYQEK